MAKPSATTPLIMSKPLMTIASALQQGYRQLRSSNSDSAKLDSEILLLKVLNAHSDIYRTKTWLLTWPETTLTAEQFQQFNHYLKLRSEGMPVAYITGEKDFWTLTLAVTPATLIPRPETELLVEYALEKISPTEKATLLELGTGSGAIALAIAAERSNVAILATDISQQALAVAQHNLERLKFSNVTFCRSDWFDAIPRQQFEQYVKRMAAAGVDGRTVPRGATQTLRQMYGRRAGPSFLAQALAGIVSESLRTPLLTFYPEKY